MSIPVNKCSRYTGSEYPACSNLFILPLSYLLFHSVSQINIQSSVPSSLLSSFLTFLSPFSFLTFHSPSLLSFAYRPVIFHTSFMSFHAIHSPHFYLFLPFLQFLTHLQTSASSLLLLLPLFHPPFSRLFLSIISTPISLPFLPLSCPSLHLPYL